jgi:hypothetical protein
MPVCAVLSRHVHSEDCIAVPYAFLAQVIALSHKSCCAVFMSLKLRLFCVKFMAKRDQLEQSPLKPAPPENTF